MSGRSPRQGAGFPRRSPGARVLGVDPGSSHTGYGVLDDDPSGPRLVAVGTIEAGRGELAVRLGRILVELEALLSTHRPDVVAVEDIFQARNARSALVLGQARGVALAAAGRARLPVHAYPTRLVKKTVTGSGGADKQQVHRVLEALLGRMDCGLDASDAVAVALCHLRFAAGPRPRRSR